MKDRVDTLAITEMALTARRNWEIVNTEFYMNRPPNEAVIGLVRDQVINPVFNTRRNYWGANVHGLIERPPLSLVKGSTLRFFQFHLFYYEEEQKYSDRPQRIIGWANPDLIRLLMYSGTTIFVDGTFRCVPSQFRQCVVVMVLDQASGIHVPVFYVLCSSKSQGTYWNVFNFVVDRTNEKLRPATVVCDFEAALINAVRIQFPETRRVGCDFHFKQAVRRKMKKLRIPETEIRIAMEKGVLDVLTVIKRKHIATKGIAHVQCSIKETYTCAVPLLGHQVLEALALVKSSLPEELACFGDNFTPPEWDPKTSPQDIGYVGPSLGHLSETNTTPP